MPPRPNLNRVPTISMVVPGAHVSIVLKQDQRTGRTVQGTVQNVLTRGNHPRGIKVRLSDGRVGRVQTMGDDGGSSSLPQSAIISQSMPSASSSPFALPAAQSIDDDAPREQIGLDAYIKPAASKQNKKRRGAAAEAANPRTPPRSALTPTPTTAMACPVCGDFEGDEAAVSHHVSTHFD